MPKYWQKTEKFNQATNHRKSVDQRVSETDARAYAHNITIEHSLSPAPNSWVTVPADLEYSEKSFIKILYVTIVQNNKEYSYGTCKFAMQLSNLSVIIYKFFIAVLRFLFGRTECSFKNEDRWYLCSLQVEVHIVAEEQIDTRDHSAPCHNELQLWQLECPEEVGIHNELLWFQ